MPPRTIMPRARVLIVDDHPAVREALALRISRRPDLEVCGEAADVTDALRLLADAQPDVAVVDISLKSGDGIDLIKRIRDRNAGVRMLVWSMHSESLYAERALRAGALGYINKEQATDKIVEAIQRVLEGKVYLSDTMTERLLRRAVGASKEVASSPIQRLADRELEVIRMIRSRRQDSGDRQTIAPEHHDRRNLPRPYSPEAGSDRWHRARPLCHTMSHRE